MHRLRKLLLRSWPEVRLVLEAALVLVLARLVVGVVPSHRLLRRFGASGAALPAETRSSDRQAARRIGVAVRHVAASLPWRSTCLVQALAARLLLVRYGLPSTLFVGVARNGEGRVTAHAWLRSGRQFVTGARGHEGFSVLARYERAPRL